MKKIYILCVTLISVSLTTLSQNVVTIDGTAPWEGFANIFDTPANGGGFIFNSGWGLGDVKSTINAADDTVTLQPNFNLYAFGAQFPPGNPDHDFWIAPSGEGNKVFEGNTFVTIFPGNPLFGQPLTFNGNVNSNTLDPDYEVMAFIKVFQNNFAVLREFITVPVVEGEDFLIEFTDPQAGDNAYQYGFFVRGLVANPLDEAALGSVVIGVGSDCDNDGILNASDPVENYTVFGPVDTFTSTSQGSDTCEAFVSYDSIEASNPCNGSDSFTVVQTEGLPSGSNFPVGTTTNTFEIENTAGTMETFSFDVTVVDGTDPVIECPEDIAVAADDSGMYTIEDYSGIASDNCDTDLEIIQEPGAGTLISDGDSQEVIITATDDAGNVSTCSFTLTVDDTLGTEDFISNTSINMYPNPAADQVTIEDTIENRVINSIVVYNMLGSIVLAPESSFFNVSELKGGTYFVQIEIDNQIITKRLIVN